MPRVTASSSRESCLPASAGVLVWGEGHGQLLELLAQGIVPASQDGGQGEPERAGVGEAAVEGSQGQGQRLLFGR